MKTVTFYGTKSSLIEWSALVARTTGRSPSPVTGTDLEINFQVDLSQIDLSTLQYHWYDVSPGSTLPWNHRISYLAK